MRRFFTCAARRCATPTVWSYNTAGRGNWWGCQLQLHTWRLEVRAVRVAQGGGGGRRRVDGVSCRDHCGPEWGAAAQGVRMGEWGAAWRSSDNNNMWKYNFPYCKIRISSGFWQYTASCLWERFIPHPPLCFVPPLCDVTKSSERSHPDSWSHPQPPVTASHQPSPFSDTWKLRQKYCTVSRKLKLHVLAERL